MMKTYFLIPLIFLSINAAEASSNIYKLGVQNTKSAWAGSDGNKDFSSSSNILNFNAGIYSDKFYGGLNISGGSFIFKDNSPSHPNKVTFDNTKPLTVSGVDLIAGYDFWNYGSIFIGVKNITITWPTNDSITWTGAGGGVQGFYPFNKKFIGYGTFSILPMFVDANDKAVGRGGFVGFSLGISYLLGKRFSINLGIKSETLSYQIENETNSYSFGGLSFGTGINF